MRLTSIILTLFAALVCTAASTTAQNMDGYYQSMKLDGSPITPGHTYHVDISYTHTDDDGIEHYITQSEIVNDATGLVVLIGEPGSLEWDPWASVGKLVSSVGTKGWLFDPFPGSGIFVADYSGAGGNTRAWVRF